jgi:hypothetical protein
MSWGHLHLMLNHLPILGTPALLALLAWGLARGLPDVTRIALWCTVALGAVTAVVYLTGEAAEEMVKALPTFQEDLVQPHESIALAATAILGTAALLAAVALWQIHRSGRLARIATRLTLVGLLAGTGAVAVTAWTGGPIGHPELRPGAAIGDEDGHDRNRGNAD